jgi:pimeloyl-ACP methyl ester carboxylesterase
MSASAVSIQDEKLKSLGLQKMTVNKEQVVSYSRGLGSASSQNPVLVLIHGYPQSSYMWRHLIALLPSDAPIFAADLPGYGASAPIEDNSKYSVGSTVLAALLTEVKRTSGKPLENLPIVLIGHDRGARVVHHLAVQGFSGVDIKGVCLIDIVPTTIQWEASSKNPAEVVGYFHWPLLANVDLATRMITAFGPGNWCEEMCLRWAGKGASGLSSFKADDSLAVYRGFFEQPHTLDASNKDYEAGATVDVEAEKGWREEGKKIGAKTLVVYSESYIGKRYDFPAVWKEWVEGDLQFHALGGGIGHFGAEEAPKETAGALKKWLKEL